MKKLRANKELEKLQGIIKLANRIYQKHKECDWSNIFHTLRCLEQSPIKRLEMSIRRANISLFAKRN